MSRYQWPRLRKNQDNPRERMRYNALSRGVMPAEARATRAMPLTAPRAAPAGDPFLWVPIGPSTVLKGQASANPRVAGRVRDIWVSPDGMRAYAGSANGGVWFSSDAGNSWSPLGNWLPTPSAGDISTPVTSLTCGCLLVSFGGDASSDDVYVGTGELRRYYNHIRGTPGDHLGGVGVLHLADAVPLVLSNPFTKHWKREGKNLLGRGIYRLARNPINPDVLVAATSVGLFKRGTATFTEDSDWAKVSVTPFDFLENSGKYITDVLWVSTMPAPRLFVALTDESSNAAAQLWTTDAGPDGPYTPVNLPQQIPYVGSLQRMTLAQAPNDPTVIYALGSGPRMWRVDGVTATEVKNLPNTMFGTSGGDQSHYDMAVAVHPDNKDIIAIGGAAAGSDGAVFQFTVGPVAPPPGLQTNFNLGNQASPWNDPTFIGNGVHADIHQIRYVKVGTDIHVWVSCDGGVFRSAFGGQRDTFVARNTGLAVVETGYVASHPVNDAFVVAGVQDNGVLIRIGDTLWANDGGGDGGGVAVNPVKNRYYVRQIFNSKWASNGAFSQPVNRSTGGASEGNEEKKASFYSGCDVLQIGIKASLVVGTNRIWLADDWDPDSTTGTSWATLPSGKDPRTGTGTDENKDTYGDRTGKIVCCKWIDSNRVVALMQPDYVQYGTDSAVLMYTRKSASEWELNVISEHSNKKSYFGNGDISQPNSSYLPPLGAWSDLAVHDLTFAPNSSLYVAATGDGTSDRMDTLWWYNGKDTWWPTGLRQNGTKAPAYAVVVDPSDHSVVYVGTALGVWSGVLSFVGGNPQWAWTTLYNGLPEAAVQDISFYRNPPTKILRAAIQARGIWELDLSAAPLPSKRTYLRVHPNDSRRGSATVLDNPMKDGPVAWRWYASPDIRIRPAPIVAPEATPQFPGGLIRGYQLWIFQTALHAIDLLCRPTGDSDAFFLERLKHNDPAKGTLIDKPRWDAVVNATNVFAPPWEGSEPTEADLYELVVEDGIDPEAGVVPAPTPFFLWPAPPPVARVLRRKHKVDVLVHYRDLHPLAKDQVRVTLLRRPLPSDVTQWGTIAISDAWKAAIELLMSGGPFGGALPDSWELADTGSITRPLTSDIDARTPRVATFDTNFVGLAAQQFVVLLAVVHSPNDKVTAASLAGATLKDLVLNCHQVCARVVQRDPNG